MAETYGDYFRGLGRSIGQGVTFGFGDEIEAGIRALGAGTYDEEVAKIRADLEKFRETNPVSAYGSEIAASLPTGLGLGALALRAGVRGIGKIGAAEGALYGAGVGEDAEGRAVSAAIGAPLGAAGAVVGEKVVRGIAPMVGKFMKRGSGSETRGATDIQLDAGDQPNSASFEAVVGTDSPNFLKSLFDKDDDFARDILGEVKAGPNADITDPVSPQELSRVRSQIQTATRDFLADQPDEMTVYRIGSVEGDAPTSFSLDPSFDGSSLPWTEPGSPVRQYKVRKEDVLAAPNAVFRPGKGTDDELEVIINANRVVSTDQPQATVFDVETGVTSPLEKTVGEPRTSGLPGGVNPAVKKMREIPGAETATDSLDFSPIENALRNAEQAMGASPTKGLTGEQYLARLPKVQSVSKAELEASGLESFLRQPENIRRKIPAQELLDVARSRLPKIKSYTLNHRSDALRGLHPEHMYDQRILRNPDEGEADDLIVDYFETVLYNENATDITPLDFGHFNNRGGEFAHARGTIINDPRAPGRQSTFIEEGQGDIVDAMVKKKTFPKQIKEAEEKLALLERQGASSDDITKQQEVIFYLSQASKAYEKAQPLTPQLRDTFDQAFEKMQADPQFKTLPDLQKRRADAIQRRGVAADEARAAAQMLPGRQGRRDIDNTIDMDFNFGNRAYVLFNQMNNARLRQDKPGGSPRLADIEIAQTLDNRLGGLGFNFFLRATDDIDTVFRVQNPDLKKVTADDFSVEALTAKQIEDAKQHAIGMHTARITAEREVGIGEYTSAGEEAVSRYADEVMNPELVPDDKVREIAVELSDRMNKIRRGFVDQTREQSTRLSPNSPERMQELRDLFDERLIREIESVSGADYIKERERWLPSVQKTVQAGEKFRAADQEASDLLIDEKTVTEEAAKRHSPGPGFLEYLSDVKKLPEIADAAQDAGDRLLPYQPYTNKFANNRAVFMNAIQKAKSQGHKYFYFPDYRDVAIRRPLEESTRDIQDGSKRMKKIFADHHKKFESTYKDAPEAVIKELKETFPNLETGTFDPESSVDFRRMFSDEMNADRMGEGMKVGERVQDRNLRPVTYIDLDTMDTNFKPRRFAKGGPVDLRSGIGNMFRLYS